MTEKIAATHEEAAKIEELMKAPFPVTLATVAKALNTTELASAQKMPDDAVAFVTAASQSALRRSGRNLPPGRR